MGININKLVFDSGIDDPNIGAFLLDSAGTRLTSTLVGADQALDVNLVQSVSLVVTATDLDIRDLTQTDEITAFQGGAPWSVSDGGGSLTVDFTRLDYSTDNVAIKGATGNQLVVNANGSIDVNLTDDGIPDDDPDSGNPLKVGGKAYSTLSAVADADRVNLASDLYRRIYVNDSANISIKNTNQSVTGTASELAATPLAGRRSITIQTVGGPIYIGKDNAVTTANGTLIPKDSSATFEFGANVDIWAISAGGAVDVRILEAA